MTTLDTLIFNLVVENSIRVLEHVWNFIVVFVVFFIYMLLIVTCDVAMMQIQGKKKFCKRLQDLEHMVFFIILIPN